MDFGSCNMKVSMVGAEALFFCRKEKSSVGKRYPYFGTFEELNRTLTAHILVQNFLPGIPNVLGVVGDFELDLNVTVEGDIAKGTASLSKQRAMGIAVKLTKRSELP